MKKLHLKLDDIRVAGFETVAREANGAGTVMGADAITAKSLCYPTCVGQEGCTTSS